MAASSPTSGSAFGDAAEGVRQAMESLRARFEKRDGTPTGHGTGPPEVRHAVLALLAEEPMHGYRIIHEIEERTAGAWTPNAGAVYPTLQLLADEASSPPRRPTAARSGRSRRPAGPRSRATASPPLGPTHPSTAMTRTTATTVPRSPRPASRSRRPRPRCSARAPRRRSPRP